MAPLDPGMLGRLAEWARGFDFDHDHLVGGLTMAQYVCDGGQAYGRHVDGLGHRGDLLFPLAADLALLVWVNDYIEFREPPGPQSGGVVITPGGTTLNDHIRHLRAVVQRAEHTHADRHWWHSTLHDACVADRAARAFSADGRSWSYSEYLDNGVNSINVPHVVATISLLWGCRIAQRRADPVVAAVIRHLGIQQRLSNDLASVAKERESGDPGNAVLLMERHLDTTQAMRFVADEQQGHHRLMTRCLAQLPPRDPLVAVAHSIAVGLEGAQRDLRRYRT